jgi:hypothetical protein
MIRSTRSSDSMILPTVLSASPSRGPDYCQIRLHPNLFQAGEVVEGFGLDRFRSDVERFQCLRERERRRFKSVDDVRGVSGCELGFDQRPQDRILPWDLSTRSATDAVTAS